MNSTTSSILKSTPFKSKFSVDNVLLSTSTPLSSKSVNFYQTKSNFIRSRNCIFFKQIKYRVKNINIYLKQSDFEFWRW